MSAALREPADLAPVRVGAGWAVRLRDGAPTTAPVTVTLASDGRVRRAWYDRVDAVADGWHAVGRVKLPGAVIEVSDLWTSRDGDVRVVRRVEVHGSIDDGFTTGLWIAADVATEWSEAEVFAPGVAYGDAGPVPAGTLGGRPARLAGVRTVLIREDRLTAPTFSLRGPDGRWITLLHPEPDAGTVSADCLAAGGDDPLCDERLRFASLGGTTFGDGPGDQLAVGLCFPGTEGEYTYSSGGLPLHQPHAWRPRYHPVAEGLTQHYELVVRLGSDTDRHDWFAAVWRWAWATFAPAADPVDLDLVARVCTAVLADQAVRSCAGTGVPLEVDAVSRERTTEATVAVVGFVGANTDVGHLLLREASRCDMDAERYRALGAQILDSFTRIRLDPPAGEGFDAFTGAPATYRDLGGRPAVYARSLSEGCLAALQAAELVTGSNGSAGPNGSHAASADRWRRWAVTGGDWLVAQQADDGSLPRAWAAGTGEAIDASTTSAYVVVPFLVALATATGEAHYLDHAVAAAEYAWSTAGRHAFYAGATLDNPDVVDKEAAILSCEGFLDLYEATGEEHWLDRARAAGGVAETWIYVWNVPMPVDADDAALHWKRDVPTVGHQLIASGVSMTDGFLAVNAAAFARLFWHTGDAHWLDVARLVSHGTTSMLALPGRTFDLRGPGWQQEHWCFAGRRGYGLNRRWLPWVPVAHVRGLHRLLDLGPPLANAVIAGPAGVSPHDNPRRDW